MCKHFDKESLEEVYKYLEEKEFQESLENQKSELEIERKERIDRKFTRES